MEPFAEVILEGLDLRGSEHALEVGAGSGALTTHLATRVESLLATDFSPGMIEILSARMAGASHVRCEVMDGTDLDAENDSFDVAASSFAMMLFPSPRQGFEELHRVVRPGGRISISAWAGPDRFDAFSLFLDAVNRAYPDLPPPPAPPPVFSLSNPDVFATQMTDAGFAGVSVDFVARELTVPGFDDAWRMMTVGAPPVEVLFDRLGPDGRARVREALAGLVEERFGRGPITLTNTATLGRGVVAARTS